MFNVWLDTTVTIKIKEKQPVNVLTKPIKKKSNNFIYC